MASTALMSSLWLLVLLALARAATASDLDDFMKEQVGLAGMDEDEAGGGLPADFSASLLGLLQGSESAAAAAPDAAPEMGQAVQKRVFCNGFTGCGGRHRGRRRYPQQPQTKRLFCNPYLGCSSGKRSQDPPAPPVQMESRLKRLFCNTYGGCRGGKRGGMNQN